MSDYDDFVRDFPGRCSEILSAHEHAARLIDKEVTLLLCVATAGFTVPFERLRPRRVDDQPHPSGDRDRYPEARIKLDELIQKDKCFLGSELWDSRSASWLAGSVTDVTIGPDLWPELALTPKKMTKQKTMNTVLGTLRNALAHGNIYTRSTNSTINQIVFVSRPIGARDYNFLAVSPQDFRTFLFRWFEFLKSLDLPGKLALEVFEYAL